jgi:hypothetical protein
MNNTLRIILHAVYACGLFLLFLLSGSKYDWMVDMDPSIAIESIKDEGNNRGLVLTIVVTLIVVIQLIIAIKTSNTLERIIAVGLALLAIYAYVL